MKTFTDKINSIFRIESDFTYALESDFTFRFNCKKKKKNTFSIYTLLLIGMVEAN